MHHFFVRPDQIEHDIIRITGSDVNHIRNVLRIRAGEQVLLSDGEGQDYTCVVDNLSEQEVICRILSQEFSGTEPAARFYLYQGMPKADKLEHIIQKSVELGVHEVIPVKTARCIVKYEEKKLEAKTLRWQKIAESAAKQSRRGIIPAVRTPISFADALKEAADLDVLLIPYENYKDMQTTRQMLAGIRPGMRVGIFIGPEGGFEQAEVDAACQAGAQQICLGSRILRTETAPLMLLSVLTFLLELSYS